MPSPDPFEFPYFWPIAADGALEAVEIPVPVGVAIGGMEAGAGATGIACMKTAEQHYIDVNEDPKSTKKQKEKAYQDWRDAQKKYLQGAH